MEEHIQFQLQTLFVYDELVLCDFRKCFSNVSQIEPMCKITMKYLTLIEINLV